MKIEQDGVQTNTTSIPFEVKSTRGVMTFGEVYSAVQGTVWLNGAMLLGPDNVWEGFDEQRDYREDTGLRVEKSTGRWATYTDNVPTLEQATGAPAPNTVSDHSSCPRLAGDYSCVVLRLRAALFRWQRSSASRLRGTH